ncbi:GH17764 [Drosophila grimshawi]|uniref:GH17764 n=1 Tax=Drosophila grimshawi TaxID=7222 RepID=B4JXM1_DROGR|nr:GH17764 [Drosophila grimshawi]
MSDIQLDPSVIVLKLPPWDINGWSSQERRSVYRNWALRYAQTRNFTVAMHYFDKCTHDMDNNKTFAALCMRSKFNREIAQPQEALEDSKKAATIASGSALVNLQIADCMISTGLRTTS